jgi:hypothetical protein
MATDTDIRTERIAAIRELSINQLAGMAECACPDSGNNEPMSAGADLLDSVRRNVLEAIEYDRLGEDRSDLAHEIADSAPDVYTHQLWSEFVDLAAYTEDPTELGFDGSDMEQGARTCLYIIAERLALALFAMLDDDDDA